MGLKVERDEGLLQSLNQLSVADNQLSFDDNFVDFSLDTCSPPTSITMDRSLHSPLAGATVNVETYTLMSSASDTVNVTSGYRKHPKREIASIDYREESVIDVDLFGEDGDCENGHCDDEVRGLAAYTLVKNDDPSVGGITILSIAHVMDKFPTQGSGIPSRRDVIEEETTI